MGIRDAHFWGCPYSLDTGSKNDSKLASFPGSPERELYTRGASNSPHAQVQFRVPERRSLGTRLLKMTTHGDSLVPRPPLFLVWGVISVKIGGVICKMVLQFVFSIIHGRVQKNGEGLGMYSSPNRKCVSETKGSV